MVDTCRLGKIRLDINRIFRYKILAYKIFGIIQITVEYGEYIVKACGSQGSNFHGELNFLIIGSNVSESRD